MYEGECIHKVSALEERCEAGVAVRELVNSPYPYWFRFAPCVRSHNSEVSCEHLHFPTPAELEEEGEKELKYISATILAASLIPKSEKAGTVVCPLCGGDLHYTTTERSMVAKCATKECLSFHGRRG